jgi:DNA primase
LQVKQANDIVEVVGGYLAIRPVGQTWKGLCPFHDDHRPSFDVDPRRQRYRCWSCGKYGDVISFVQEFEKVGFREALELLARRAGIEFESAAPSEQALNRAALLDVMRWATKQFHECLLEALTPEAEGARRYLAERGLKGETVRRYALGYAPRSGEWLVQRAHSAGVSLELLEKVGLIAQRSEESAGEGFYDRFRDRLQFPIRDARGQTVGFGGRILPHSALAARGPKYYNSCDTPLFSKSEQLYGLDQARFAADRAGYLAVVEGYTDVLMAHQEGIGQVVATMGTALNARHVQQLRRFAPRVVLVFDADAGGVTGVDRALEIFAGHEVELSIATLPAGLDPCDLLQQQGASAFRAVLEAPVDALEYKLEQALARDGSSGVEGARRVVDAVLGVIALAPPIPGQAGAVKSQLMINRIARRLALKEETVWARLEELRRQAKQEASRSRRSFPPAGASQPSTEEEVPALPGTESHSRPAASTPSQGAGDGRRQAPAAPEELQLLEVLLADPQLVPEALRSIRPDEVQHPGLRRLYQGLADLHAAGEPPTLDRLRPKLESVPLANRALEMQDVGRANPNRPAWLRQLLDRFQARREQTIKQALHNQLQAAHDHAAALELLRRLQNRTSELGPDAATTGSWGDGAAPSASSDTGVRS